MTATTLINSPLELATILIRHHGIHRGLWALTVNFHVQGTNFCASAGDGTAFPGALLAVQGIGIHEVEVPDALTVDAAAVNPTPSSKVTVAT
ncbi:hypothetical protein [Cupriavidus sp. SW-Y-13]|uniref:hypothetical protein n=1 Tax=Cupriavidus sp. SW-Y-13 TaxID=2653854 RepID=UPI0013660DA7|nr:hypothetical protein [Cupriavidus sp. SW-Y-13]MWL91232.1 hypothetical protein [Cupriavidus sp. SW-Y-13]